MDKYFIDPRVVSLLFNEDNDEKVMDIYKDLNQRIIIVVEKTTETFLKENGLSDEQIKEINSSDNLDLFDEKIKGLINNPELGIRIEKNTNDLLKVYFDDLMPRLSEEKRTELEQYMKDALELKKLQDDATRDDLNETKELLQYYGAKDLNEALEKSKDPNFTKEPSSPSINLGGVNTTTEAPSTQNVQEVVPTVVESQIESVTLPAQPEPAITQQAVEPIINPIDTTNNTEIPQGGAVDMALQSAITPAETQVFDNITPTEAEPKIPEVAPVTELPNLSLDSDMPIPPAPPVAEMIMPVIQPVQGTPEVINPESITNNDIQFTPLTEVPASPVLDNQLPPLPETTIAEPVATATESVPEVPQIEEPVKLAGEITPQVPLGQPTSAAAKLDILGISLDDNTEQKV